MNDIKQAIGLLNKRLDVQRELIVSNHRLIQILMERIEIDEKYFKKYLELKKWNVNMMKKH